MEINTSTIVTFIMVARGTLAQPLNCPSELYSRMFMLGRLKYGIIPLVEDLRNQTASHLSNYITTIIDGLEAQDRFPALPAESSCTDCGQTTNCFKQDCHLIESLLAFLNTKIASKHKTLVANITSNIKTVIIEGAMVCGAYTGPILGDGYDNTVDGQYRTASDTYNFLQALQKRYS